MLITSIVTFTLLYSVLIGRGRLPAVAQLGGRAAAASLASAGA